MSCCSACGTHACACGCGAIAGTPLPLGNRSGLDALAYRVGTYADFRATMVDDLSDAALPALAGLRTRDAGDPAIALLDAWAVCADVLSFYSERIANEGYLRTATERRSVLELGRLLDYRLRPGVAASVYLAYTVEQGSPAVTIPAGARAQSVPAPGEQMQTFETTDPLDARFEWNALQPRLTRPQAITRDSLGGVVEVGFAGAALNLKPNDWLVFEFSDGLAPAARQIQQVTADAKRKRTQVSLQPVPAAAAAVPQATAVAAAGESVAPAVGRVPSAPLALARKDLTPFGALVDALQQRPTQQPANARRLSRSVASALGTASDVRSQLLLHVDARLQGSFYPAWTSVPAPAGSAQVARIFVQRVAAARFGYNAVWPIELKKDGEGGFTSQQASNDWELDPGDNVPGTVFLDNAYDGIVPGSYAIVTDPPVLDENGKVAAPAKVQVHRVLAVSQHPRSAYGISGKTTELQLSVPVQPLSSDVVLLISDSSNTPLRIPPSLRVQQLFVRSEPLSLAEAPVTQSVGSTRFDDATDELGDNANRLTLDVALDGFKAGRWVIVSGRRADVPGTEAVSAAELVMVSAVEQASDAQLPGDTVHTTLVFANQGLAFTYARDSVMVYANVARATHGATRSEVLGSGSGAASMQAFALKQAPLTYVSAATVDGVQSTLAVRVNNVLWHETRNLALVDADARRFVTATDDDGSTRVIFGDGSHGARLPTGIENVKAGYRNGIGTPGNVVAQQISLLATRPLGVKAVINPLRASGGADAETRDQARRNVPLAVLALDRLVSVPDYADFARTFGGVGKAAAIKLGNLVQVTIAGAADAPIDPSSDLYRNLLQALQRYGDPLLPLRLDVRELLALTVSAKVGLVPDHAWESVEPVLRAALLDAFGFERRALAQSVYLSEIVACMQAVRGVAWVDVDALGALDETTLLAGFGDGQSDRDAQSGSRVVVAPARFDSAGQLHPAQLAYLPPDIPDTLLLQEATS